MGNSIGAFAIRKNYTFKDSALIIRNLFSKYFEELNHAELFSHNKIKKFDTRLDDCFTIFKTEDLIFIANSKFTSKFFLPFDQEFIQKVFTFFEKPRQIFAFEEYESGATYGYSLIMDGKILRTYESSNDSVKQFGEPVNIECKWLNTEKVDFIDDGENYLGFIHPDDKAIHHIGDLPPLLFSEVFNHEIGYGTWELSAKAIETRYFRLK